MKHLKAIIPIFGFVAVCIFIFSSIDLSNLKQTLLSANPNWLLLAFGITLFQPFLTSLRLQTYLIAGNHAKPYHRCLKAVLAASSLNAVLPAKGGDLVKVTFLQDDPNELSPLAGLALLERVIDILVLCLLSLAGSLYVSNNTTTIISLFALSAPIGALLLLGKADRVPIIGKKLVRLAMACRAAWSKPFVLLRGLVIAVLCWSTNLTVMYCLFKSVGALVSVIEVAAATPLAIFVGLLPISISGMGTRDAALVSLLPDIAKEITYSATFLYTASVYWFLALIGLVFLGKEVLRLTLSKTQQNQSSLKKVSASPT